MNNEVERSLNPGKALVSLTRDESASHKTFLLITENKFAIATH